MTGAGMKASKNYEPKAKKSQNIIIHFKLHPGHKVKDDLWLRKYLKLPLFLQQKQTLQKILILVIEISEVSCIWRTNKKNNK